MFKKLAGYVKRFMTPNQSTQMKEIDGSGTNARTIDRKAFYYQKIKINHPKEVVKGDRTTIDIWDEYQDGTREARYTHTEKIKKDVLINTVAYMEFYDELGFKNAIGFIAGEGK